MLKFAIVGNLFNLKNPAIKRFIQFSADFKKVSEKSASYNKVYRYLILRILNFESFKLRSFKITR